MDKAKRERINAMILMFIIFCGINYVLFAYVLTPKMDEVDEAKGKYEAQDTNRTIQQVMELEKENLQDEIVTLEIVNEEYDALVSDKLDTINMTVDFYNYLDEYKVNGLYVTYNISDILEGINKNSGEEDDELEGYITDPDDPNYNPLTDPTSEDYDPSLDPNAIAVDDSASEEVMFIEAMVEEETFYRTGVIKLDTEMDKSALKGFLENLGDISVQNTFVKSIEISTSSETNVGDGDVINTVEKLLVTVTMDTYVNDGVVVDSTQLTYDFYQEMNTHYDYDSLFSAGEVDSIE